MSEWLLGEYHLAHFIWPAESFHCTPTDDTPPFFLLCDTLRTRLRKRLLGANYSQHVLYTPFNELDWRHGHWLWLARPVIQDELCNLPHVTPVMCTESPSASNSLLGLHWSRDEAPLKQHNSSRSVSAHRAREGLGGGWCRAGSSLS